MDTFLAPKLFIQSIAYEAKEDVKPIYINPETHKALTGYDSDGNKIEVPLSPVQENPKSGNSLLLLGKKYVGQLITSMASGGFTYFCVGASSVAINQVNHDRLGPNDGTAHEYIGNASRKPLLSVLNPGNPISSSDWVADTYTDPITGVVYHAKLDAYVVYDTTDGNNGDTPGNPFNKIGLNTSPALPATVSGYSGLMLNNLIDSSTQYKRTTTIIQYNLTLRV